MGRNPFKTKPKVEDPSESILKGMIMPKWTLEYNAEQDQFYIGEYELYNNPNGFKAREKRNGYHHWKLVGIFNSFDEASKHSEKYNNRLIMFNEKRIDMKLILSPQAFWDVDLKSIQGKEKEYASWVIKRIAQYGTVDDMVSIDLFYGRKKIIEVINSMSESEKSKSMLMTTFVA